MTGKEEYVHRPKNEDAEIKSALLKMGLGIGIALGVGLTLFLTIESWIFIVSHQKEREVIDRYANLLERFSDNDETDTELSAREEWIVKQGRLLAQETELPEGLDLRFHYSDSAEANALTLPGGHIVVLDGLWNSLESENAMTFTLCHEIGHAIHRDPLVGAGRAFLLQFALAAATGQSGGPPIPSNFFFMPMAETKSAKRTSSPSAVSNATTGTSRVIGSSSSLCRKSTGTSRARVSLQSSAPRRAHRRPQGAMRKRGLPGRRKRGPPGF